jgi:hypothetical protein
VTGRLLLSSVSALALTLLAAVCLHGVASLHQRQALGSATAQLEASARAVEGELNLRGRTLAELSEELATDPDLPGELEAAGDRADHRIKQLRGVRPDVDSMTLMNAEGVVVATNAPRYHAGDNLVAGRRAASDEGAAPGRSTPPKTPGLLDAVLAGYPSRGISFFDGALYHWGSAPIRVKGSIVGAVLIERRLQSLPAVAGGEAFLVIGGKVVLGKAQEGWRNHLGAGPEKSFLLTTADAVAGGGEKRPMFIDEDRVGIWARRFQVPGSAAPLGFVTVDLTSGFAELASFQRMIMILFALAWLAHVTLLFTATRLVTASATTSAQSKGSATKGATGSFGRRAIDSLGRLFGTLRARLAERVPALRTQTGELPAGSRAPTSPDPQTIIGEPAGLSDVAEEDKTPPLGEVAKARPLPAGLSAEPPPLAATTGETAVDADEDDATSAMAMTPELMDELGLNKTPEDGAHETQVMTVTAELLADMKADMKAEKADKADAKAALKADTKSPEAAAKAAAPVEKAPTPTAKALAPVEKAPASVEKTAAPVEKAPAPVEKAAAPAEKAAEEPMFRDLYARFSSMRRICGEAGELAFETFKQDLEKSRAEVMAKHNCKEVRFHVTIQGGKAVFMAAPAP